MATVTLAADARAPGAAPPPAQARQVFLDALRGFALIFMVLNHTGRWWQDGVMGWPRYYMIYVTMAVAAPIFLFLVGFCLPLSGAREEPRPLRMLGKYAVRGARLIGAGLLLNVLVFPEEPIYGNGVLQTIGLSIVVAAAGGLALRRPGMRPVVAAVAVLLYLAFGWSFADLTRWVEAHPSLAHVLFYEFPPWPWVSLVLLGLVLGDVWTRQRDAAARARYMWAMAGAGALCLAIFFAHDGWAHTPDRFTFKRDFILNHHWTPRGVSVLWILGTIALLMPAFYVVADVWRWRLTWLVTYGRTALILYFVHQLIVLTLVNQWLGLRANDWWRYGAANLALLIALLGLGRLWLEVRAIVKARAIAYRRTSP